MRTPVAAALVTASLLAACTAQDPDPAPDAAPPSSTPSAGPATVPSLPHRPVRTWSAAPPGFSVTVVRTRFDGTVLAVRTVGSSSCAFEIDDVRVEGAVLHVVDEATGVDRVCTADARPSRTSWPVPRTLVEPLRDTETAVLHLESGRSFGVPLLAGME